MSEDHFLPPGPLSRPINDNVVNSEDKKIIEFLNTKTVVPVLPQLPNVTKYLTKRKTVNENNTISDHRSLIANYA